MSKIDSAPWSSISGLSSSRVWPVATSNGSRRSDGSVVTSSANRALDTFGLWTEVGQKVSVEVLDIRNPIQDRPGAIDLLDRVGIPDALEGGDAIAKATGLDFFSVPIELGVSRHEIFNSSLCP